MDFDGFSDVSPAIGYDNLLEILNIQHADAFSIANDYRADV